MAKFKNENGEEFEAFTQEELDAKASELATAAAAKAVEDYKKANPAKKEEPVIEKKQDGDPVAKLAQTVEALQKQLLEEKVANFARTFAGSEATKQAEFKAKFERLTGYPETPEGLAERAADAARMIGVNPSSVDISGVAGTGGGRNVDGTGKPAATEADKVVQKVLGITEADVKKYGGETKV